MEHLHGFGGLGLSGHLDEREAPRAPRGAILHDIHRDNAARLGKVVLEVVFGGVIREVTYE
jgi:hypothetical protein